MAEAAKTGDEIKNQLEEGRKNNLDTKSNVTINLGKSEGGNPWLGGTVYLAFLEIFMELQRILMKNKVVQGNVELAGMNLTVTLAESTKDAILAIAHMNQALHIASAVMCAVSIAISIGGLAMTSLGAKAGANPPKPGSGIDGTTPAPKYVGFVEMGGVVGQMGPQVEKMSTAMGQVPPDVLIGQKEGLKEMLQAYRTLAQHQMDKGSEAFKASEDQITQLLQSLDK